MRLSEGEPCGSDCFKLVPDIEKYAETLPPSSNDPSQTPLSDILSTIMGIAPDLYPCQLAVLCFKPCKEVWNLCKLLQELSTVKRFSTKKEEEEEKCDCVCQASLKEPYSPVHIQGHALLQVVIAMLANSAANQHVDVVYHVSDSCLVVHVNNVKMEIAPVDKMGGNVFQVSASDVMLGSRKDPCPNTKMQRQDIKMIEVKAGSYGLGAFAAENMVAGDLLGTYVGHVVCNDRADLTDAIRKHNRRNYLFEFSRDIELIFDAARVGNMTRFLNHNDAGNDNVDAKTMLVNGEHQIGFFVSECSIYTPDGERLNKY
ncbi:hypothetical protein ID866_4539 [Astraeus odoratus]|nr:hypothetical protein ID866_4539 [Astraeus odoratus]